LNETHPAGVLPYSSDQRIIGGYFMKISRWLVGVVLVGMCVPVAVRAQATATSAENAKKAERVAVPLKLEIVLSEYDGTKKVSSLPYTIPVVANGSKLGDPYSRVRIGVRVPVEASTKSGESSFQYIDVGTSIDARAASTDDDRYEVLLTVDRSSLYIASHEDGKLVEKEWSEGEAPPGGQPLIRQYRGAADLYLREGQATEVAVATDPLSGHVLKVEVTVNVVK
jgi:hypothetical protein